ncbi:ABC transporter substrate-binding protein [Simplicispira psychrophila]|uniref:ABC transporter substrate-binding protein n=1 Tax=Simplicispira psychrophila TaxID=80882 RepID=UPI00146FAA1A|nr:ABC transporter substrate-binding protein [Simplicispira psychrophila]
MASDPVYIGLDAEFGHATSTSAQAVQQGIQIALDEINAAGGVLGGRQLELITRDNRSITAVGRDNFQELAQVKDLIAVFGGKFSPIYVECLPLAHELQVPLMDPWGAADQITDHHFRPNYVFRLSLKDAWAASAFMRFAQQQYQAKRIGLMLPNTAWGRSNKAALDKAAGRADLKIVGEHWYNWGDQSLIQRYQELRAAGAQVLVLVANEVEGAILVKEIAALPAAERIPLISHWGITGGEFARMTEGALDQVELSVVQTFSFLHPPSPRAKKLAAAMKTRYGVASAAQIKSPVGVAQAYDLTHLLVQAMQKAGSTDRPKIREALEHLPAWTGAVRHYAKPFTATRHDALSQDNVFFVRYTAQDTLVPIPAVKR